MDSITALDELVRETVRSYSTYGYNMAGQYIKLYFVENPLEQVFAILGPYDPAEGKAELVMMARIVNDQIIIDFDKSSKSLASALIRAGIPEAQIVVAGRKAS